LEAPRSLLAWARGLLLDDIDGPPSLAASMSTVAEHFESWIDAIATNRVRWGSRSALVIAVSHFLELDVELEVLGFRRNMGLIEDEVDALWSRVHAAVDSLALHIPSSVIRNPPVGAGE
jgi:hypothetical protein